MDDLDLGQRILGLLARLYQQERGQPLAGLLVARLRRKDRAVERTQIPEGVRWNRRRQTETGKGRDE